MKKTAATIGFLSVLLSGTIIFPSVAQNPQFPQTLPANTVVGRTGIGPGPAQAIPFQILTNNLLSTGFAPNSIANGVLANMAGGTVKCKPAGASTGAPQDCSYPAINVTDAPYSADPTGVADSTAAIQNAINALPLVGGDIIFPAGTYKITSTINIGNGTSSAVSTRYGVRLLGGGMPVQPVGFAGYPTAPAVKLLWAGAAAGIVVKVNGPLQGWGLQNLVLDCASSANRGLNVISGQWGDTKNLVVLNCETWGLFSETVAPFGGVTFTGSGHNRYENTTITVPSGAVGGGIVLTSAGSTSNTLFNHFNNTTVAIAGNAQTGIYLQAAAGNTFYQTHITGVAGDTSVTFDYTVNNTWPANNVIDAIEPIVGATFVSNVGSPGGGARPNYLRNLITTDGAAYPTLANLVTDGGTAAGQVLNSTGNGLSSWLATPTLGANGGTGGSLTLNGATSGSAALAASATGGHTNFTSSSTPTITAGCTGAGSGITGTDLSGTVTGSTAAATTCTITFGTAFAAVPSCQVTGLNSPLTGAIVIATNTLQVSFTSTTNYKFNYFCPGV